MNFLDRVGPQAILAIFFPAAFVLVVILWMLHPPDAKPEVLAVLNTLIGSLGTGAGMVLSYYFGSSSGSTAKDDTLRRLATTGTGTGTPPPDSTTTTTTTTKPS